MLEQISSFVSSIQNNQLLILLFSGGIVWTLISNLTNIFRTIWQGILACISFTVNTVSLGDYDIPLLMYKTTKVFSESTVLWERNSEIRPQTSEYSETHLTNSAYGRSYRWMWGHLVILDREYTTNNTKVVVRITARVFFANRKKFLERLTKAIENCSLNDKHDTIFVNMGKGIEIEKPKRSIDSVYSNDGTPQKILSDIKAFLNNKELYIKGNSPYKFVSLLTGTPGTGKTSAIHAIASELNMGVRFINTDSDDFDDIARIMSNNSEYSSSDRNIIVIEDVDCMTMSATDNRNLSENGEVVDINADITVPVKFKRNTKKYDELIEDKQEMSACLSLTSILNLLDGIVTPSGTIVFLTSNNPEKLDKALLRDGRIDGKYHFDRFNGETANRLINDYLGFTIENIKNDIAPSSIQRDVMKVMIGQMSKDTFIAKYTVAENSEI